jgi:exopolysaccharide production protein ExoZ
MIRPIQYLRAVAALSVVGLHALVYTPGLVDILGPPHFRASGVDLFFVISGFIMLITTHNKLTSGFQFFCLRIIRVVPMYWLCTLTLLVCGMTAGHMMDMSTFNPEDLITSLLFIPLKAPILYLGWTLNYEMFFYGLFAISLAIPQRFRLVAFLTSMATLVAAGYVLKLDNPIFLTYTNPLLLEFAFGATIGYLWISGRLKINLVLSLLAIAVGLFLLFRWNQPPFRGKTQMLGSLLVVVGCLHPMLCTWKNRLFLELGDASYSIYLTHPFVLAVLRVVWARMALVSITLAIAYMVFALLTAAASGWLCYRLVEKPITARLRKLTKPKSPDIVPTFAAS